jgi:hypothetical protein
MPALVRVQEQDPVPGQVLVPGRGLVPGQVLVPERGLRAQVPAVRAWALEQGQALDKAVLARGAHTDPTALVPVTERDLVGLVRQTAQAMALVTAQV